MKRLRFLSLLAVTLVVISTGNAFAAPSATALSVSPKRLNFGRIAVGTPSFQTAQSFTVTNNTVDFEYPTGVFFLKGQTTGIFLFSDSGGNCNLYSVTSGNGLPPGQTCQYEISMNTGAAGRGSDTFEVRWQKSDNVTFATIDVALRGAVV